MAVVVAVALLAVAMPTLDDARDDTTAERLDAEAERLERQVGALAADSVAVAEPALAARATVTVRVPHGLTASRVERAAIGDPALMDDVSADAAVPNNGGSSPTDADSSPPEVAFVYRLAGTEPRVVPLSSPHVPTVEVVGGPIRLRTGGESRLRLTLVDDGGPTVRIARVG